VKDNGDLPFSVDEETVVEVTNCVGDAVSEQFFKDHQPPPPPINLQTEESLPNFVDEPQPETSSSKRPREEDLDHQTTTMAIPCLITPSMSKRRPQTTFYPFDSEMYTYSSSEEEGGELGEGKGRERKEQEGEGEGNMKKRCRIEE
jgi:hypothetical protein